MARVQLGSGLLRRGDTVLLVRCRYAGEPDPLWTLPGGRPEAAETIAEAVTREFLEETSLAIRLGDLAYVSESIDLEGGLHVLNCTFWVGESDPRAQLHSADPKVVESRFVPVSEAPALLRADVLRIPVAAALAGNSHPRYFLFNSKDVAVPFFSYRRKQTMTDIDG